MEKMITPLRTIFTKHQKFIYCVLLIGLGIFILAPSHNFQPALSQGDHGRDLYVAQQILEGKIPYRDFWWVYGPAMPYYYALSYKILGISIQSVLTAEIILRILSALLLFLSLARVVSVLPSFLAGAWLLLLQPHFPHTYNHTGGILAFMLILYFLFSYIKTSKNKFIVLGFFGCVVLFLIKLNFGLFMLIALMLCFTLIDFVHQRRPWPWKIYALCFLGTCALTALIYWGFVRGLASYEIQQCFPLLRSARQHHGTMWENIKVFLLYAMPEKSFSPASLGLTLFFISGFFLFCNRKPKDENEKQEKTNIALALSSLFIFIIFSLHEFVESSAIYRLYATYWAKPFEIAFIFLAAGAGFQKTSKILKIAIFSLLLILLNDATKWRHRVIHILKNPNQQFQIGPNTLYVTNSPRWRMTVYQTISYLKDHLKAEETFFALPYDVLYYFLAERTSPTRQLIFFDFINIPTEQEIKIIQDLERNQVNYIVLSNRVVSSESGLGNFGQTYCPVLARYLLTNFEAVATFGDWSQEADWVERHATKIFRRKLR